MGTMQALVGTTQGNSYQLERLLQEGRHGALFEAKQIRLGFRCVVRMLSVDPAQRKAFLSTLSQQTQLAHPGLGTVTDAMQLSDDSLLVATLLLPGQSLSDRLATQGKLSLSEGLAVARTLAGALHALHQRGLCHGAVSTRNVLIVGFDDVAVDGALGGGKVNQRAVLVDGGLYVATKEPASAADDQAALAQLIEEAVSDLTPPLRSVLGQAKDANPNNRFQTLQAFWQAIESARGRKVAAAVPTAMVGQVRMPNLSEKANRVPLLLAAAAFLVLAVVVAIVGLRRPAPADTPTVKTVALPESEVVIIQLEINPPGAQVFLAGKPASLPLRLKRSSEPVPLRIDAEGFLSSNPKVVPDRDRVVNVTLAPASEPADTAEPSKKPRKRKKVIF